MTRSSTHYVANFGSNSSCRGNRVGHFIDLAFHRKISALNVKYVSTYFTDFKFMLTAINPSLPLTNPPRLLRGEDYALHLYVSVDEDIVATEEDIVSWAFPIDISERTV